MIRKRFFGATGFTLTESLVLFGVGSVLAGVLLADLTQARAKLLQQACAANLRQWGMAIDLYTKDNDGTYYYRVQADDWADVGSTRTNRYVPYLGGGDQKGTLRNMRICPVVATYLSQSAIINASFGTIYSYSMAKPQAKYGGAPIYRNIDLGGSPFMDQNGGIWPTLKYVPNPSQYLLLIESSGHTLSCGGLVFAVTSVPTVGPPLRAIDRHGGSINCLFGDFHVSSVTTQALIAADMGGCGGPNGNPWFNMN